MYEVRGTMYDLGYENYASQNKSYIVHRKSYILEWLTRAQKARMRGHVMDRRSPAPYSEDCFLPPTITRSLTFTSDMYRFSPLLVS